MKQLKALPARVSFIRFAAKESQAQNPIFLPAVESVVRPISGKPCGTGVAMPGLLPLRRKSA